MEVALAKVLLTGCNSILVPQKVHGDTQLSSRYQFALPETCDVLS